MLSLALCMGERFLPVVVFWGLGKRLVFIVFFRHEKDFSLLLFFGDPCGVSGSGRYRLLSMIKFQLPVQRLAGHMALVDKACVHTSHLRVEGLAFHCRVEEM